MGVIVPGTDLQKMLLDDVIRLDGDGMLGEGDVLSITESIVARAQNNMITTEETAEEIRNILSLTPSGRVGLVFPIASRNRFSLILESDRKSSTEKRGDRTVLLSGRRGRKPDHPAGCGRRTG